MSQIKGDKKGLKVLYGVLTGGTGGAQKHLREKARANVMAQRLEPERHEHKSHMSQRRVPIQLIARQPFEDVPLTFGELARYVRRDLENHFEIARTAVLAICSNSSGKVTWPRSP